MELEARQNKERIEGEVAELRGQLNDVRDQMTEMMRLLQNMNANRTANTGNNQSPPINEMNSGNNLGTQEGPSNRGGPVPVIMEQVPRTVRPQTIPVFEEQVGQEWNQGGVYTYDLPGPDANATVITPGLIANNTNSHGEGSGMKEGWKEEMNEMKNQLQALQGTMPWKSVDLNELCLAPEIPIPKKFKVPEFTKYDGSGDPHYHLKTYCTRMSVWSRDERFLIHFFHESLTGAALHWFMNLDHSKLKKWRDLTDIFMRHYQFNLNVAPTREQLKGLKRKASETFKEYAQRWRATASQVQPPLIESELCSYFIGTLREPYFKIMLGTHAKYFTDLIEVGERIDANVRDGKLESASQENQTRPVVKTKEDEVSHIPEPYQQPHIRPHNPCYQHPRANHFHTYSNPSYSNPSHSTPYQPRVSVVMPFQPPQPVSQAYSSQPIQNITQGGDPRPVRPPRDDRSLPNFNITRSELFKNLVEKNLISPRPTRPWQPPFPSWYNPNETCEYHMGVAGHTIDGCDAFRRHVLNLLDNNYISVRKDNNPNVVPNPLPEHDNGK